MHGQHPSLDGIDTGDKMGSDCVNWYMGCKVWCCGQAGSNLA